MDFASVLDMLDRTAVDKVDAAVTFATASDTLRVALSVEDSSFSIGLHSSTGDSLLVTPGQVAATDGAAALHVASVDTAAALAAWKAMPPTSFAPIASGLALLTTADAAVNAIIARLAGFSGSLGIGVFSALCWYSARYPSLTFGDVVLTDVVGRICLRDVVLATDHVGFGVELVATATTCRVRTAVHKDPSGTVTGEDTFALVGVTLRLNATADLDLVNETADVVLTHANFDADQSSIVYGAPADPWRITAAGARVEVENLRQTLATNPPTQLSTRGHLRFTPPVCSVSKASLAPGTGTVIEFLAPFSVTGLNLDLEIATAAGQPSQTIGAACLDELSFQINYTDENVAAQNVNGTLRVDSHRFSPQTVATRFELLGASVASVRLATGRSPLERLELGGGVVDIAGEFSAANGRTVLLLEKLHASAAQGAWAIVLQAVNSGSATDPLKLAFSSATGNAIELFAQPFLSVGGPSPRATAEQVEVRIRDAHTAAPISRFILSEHHELTTASFAALRAVPVPEPVLAKIEPQLLDVQFKTGPDLLAEVQRRLSASEFSTFGAAIDAAAAHHQTFLSDAQLEIEDVAFRGSLLAPAAGGPRLDGELSWSVFEFGFDEIVGLEIPNFQNLTNVKPISPGDRYPVVAARFQMPEGTFLPGAAAFSQGFESVTIDVGGVPIAVNPGANRLRVNLLAQLPVAAGVVAQVSVPSATLDPSGVNLPLTNAFVDVFSRLYTPTINANQRALRSETVLRFGITSGPLQFRLYQGSTRDISHNELGLDKVIRLFTELLNKAHIPIPAGAFDAVARAFDNPAVNVAGDIVQKLNDIIEGVTGFGIDDFGLRIKTHDVTAQVLPAPASNQNRVAVSLRVHLPEIGAFVSYSWREPRLGIPPWEDEHDSKGFTADILPFELDLVLLLSYRINAVAHSVEVTDIDLQVVPSSTSPVTIPPQVVSEAFSLVEAMTGVAEIRATVVRELGNLFRIALPDTLNLDLARIDFDASGNMTISVEARQLDFNPL